MKAFREIRVQLYGFVIEDKIYKVKTDRSVLIFYRESMPANFFVVNIFFGAAVTEVSSEAPWGAAFALICEKTVGRLGAGKQGGSFSGQ